MIVTKENGTVYTNGLTMEVINWHKEVGYIIADVKRPLTMVEEEINDITPLISDSEETETPLFKNVKKSYVDDITTEEIEAGYEAVRGFLYREVTDPLFFKVQRGEIEESVWLDEIQKIKDENKPKTENNEAEV